MKLVFGPGALADFNLDGSDDADSLVFLYDSTKLKALAVLGIRGGDPNRAIDEAGHAFSVPG